VLKACVARPIVNVNTDLVTQIREEEMSDRGVNVTKCQSDIAADRKIQEEEERQGVLCH
jgi:hypothetical protein